MFFSVCKLCRIWKGSPINWFPQPSYKVKIGVGIYIYQGTYNSTLHNKGIISSQSYCNIMRDNFISLDGSVCIVSWTNRTSLTVNLGVSVVLWWLLQQDTCLWWLGSRNYLCSKKCMVTDDLCASAITLWMTLLPIELSVKMFFCFHFRISASLMNTLKSDASLIHKHVYQSNCSPTKGTIPKYFFSSLKWGFCWWSFICQIYLTIPAATVFIFIIPEGSSLTSHPWEVFFKNTWVVFWWFHIFVST